MKSSMIFPTTSDSAVERGGRRILNSYFPSNAKFLKNFGQNYIFDVSFSDDPLSLSDAAQNGGRLIAYS